MQKRTLHHAARRAGFTLLELLIVLAIIVVIAAMVVPNLLGNQELANIQSTKVAIAGVEKSIKLYKASRGAFIEGGDDVLESMTQPSEFEGRRMAPALENLPVDSWGNTLHYQWPNTKDDNSFKPAIWSNGPDGKNDDGGGDDINNWTQAQPGQKS